jgi:hypothetical protein
MFLTVVAVNKVSAGVVYDDLCRKFVRFFEIGLSSRDKEAVLALVAEAQIELASVDENPKIPRSHYYSCAIIVSLMQYFSAYAAQSRSRIDQGVSLQRVAIRRALFSPADLSLIRAIMHQYEANEVVDIDQYVELNANPDLYTAAHYIRELAPYIRQR